MVGEYLFTQDTSFNAQRAINKDRVGSGPRVVQLKYIVLLKISNKMLYFSITFIVLQSFDQHFGNLEKSEAGGST